jgi:hypothetical protein
MAMFHLYNGDSFEKHVTISEALASAAKCIDIARDCCDPEWPSWVEEIAIYEAPDDCEWPQEDGALQAVARMINIRDAEDGDGVDFWCDYGMAPPTAAPSGA